jgi:hypothetical protein
MRAAGVEPAIQLARDVPWALDEQPKRNIAAKQPVHAGDMRPQVATDEYCPPSICQECAKAVITAYVESAQYLDIGQGVECVVSPEEPRGVGREYGPSRHDRPIGIEC